MIAYVYRVHNGKVDNKLAWSIFTNSVAGAMVDNIDPETDCFIPLWSQVHKDKAHYAVDLPGQRRVYLGDPIGWAVYLRDGGRLRIAPTYEDLWRAHDLGRGPWIEAELDQFGVLLTYHGEGYPPEPFENLMWIITNNKLADEQVERLLRKLDY